MGGNKLVTGGANSTILKRPSHPVTCSNLFCSTPFYGFQFLPLSRRILGQHFHPVLPVVMDRDFDLSEKEQVKESKLQMGWILHDLQQALNFNKVWGVGTWGSASILSLIQMD